MRIDQATRFDRGTSPIWSPNGKSLFYLRQGKLYERNLTGGPAQEHPHPGVDALSQLLGWVRDSSGQLLATSKIGTEVEQVWLIDPKSGKATRLPYDVAYLCLPNLSPDGKSLVHSKYAGAGSRTELYLRRPDGKDKPLTKDDYDDEYPCWSPDGKSIVFVSDRP
jgi:Tol biopolymer transport system component